MSLIKSSTMCALLWITMVMTARSVLSQATSEAPKPPEFERITAEELKAKIARNEPVTILDVRSGDVYSRSDSKIRGAMFVRYRRHESGAQRFAADAVVSRLAQVGRPKLYKSGVWDSNMSEHQIDPPSNSQLPDLVGFEPEPVTTRYDAPAVRIQKTIFEKAVELDASDIHIEPRSA